MDGIGAGLAGAVGTVAFFGFVAFVVWLNYRKEKEQRDVAHQERMKALELGHPPFDAEVARARAYASAAWAAGVIGLVIPIVIVSLAVAGTIVAVIFMKGENIAGPLIVAWSIAGVLAVVAITRSLSVIQQLPRPTTDGLARGHAPGKRADAASADFAEKRLEL